MTPPVGMSDGLDAAYAFLGCLGLTLVGVVITAGLLWQRFRPSWGPDNHARYQGRVRQWTAVDRQDSVDEHFGQTGPLWEEESRD